MKVLLVGFTILFAVASPVFAQQAPPPSEKAKQIETLVTKSAALIDKNGKAAFADFRKKDSEWFHGDTYLFVYDLKANVLLNPAFPQREGTNVTGQKDAKGKLLHQEIIRVAETDGSGWVDYMFPKSGQTVPSQKWTFVKKVMIDSTPGLVASFPTRHDVRFGSNADTCSAKLMSALPLIATAKADFRKQSCPLYSRKRTCAVQTVVSALGQ